MGDLPLKISPAYRYRKEFGNNAAVAKISCARNEPPRSKLTGTKNLYKN